MKKFLILFFIFYFLVLFQTTFLVHFDIKEQVPNLILILLFLMAFYFYPTEMQSEYILAGFFLDIFSNYFFGVSIILLLLNGFLITKFLKHFKKTNILVFMFLFLIFQFFYYFPLNVFAYLLKQSNFLIKWNLFLIQILYNFVFGIMAFLFAKLYVRIQG